MLWGVPWGCVARCAVHGFQGVNVKVLCESCPEGISRSISLSLELVVVGLALALVGKLSLAAAPRDVVPTSLLCPRRQDQSAFQLAFWVVFVLCYLAADQCHSSPLSQVKEEASFLSFPATFTVTVTAAYRACDCDCHCEEEKGDSLSCAESRNCRLERRGKQGNRET